MAKRLERLVRNLESKDRYTRKRATYSLGQLKDEQAVKPLVKALGDPDSYVQEAGIHALQLRGAAAVEPLLQALASENQNQQKNAAQVLGWLGERVAVEPLLQMLRSDSTEVLEAVAEALGRIGDTRAVAPLKRALKDPNPGLRRVILEALGQLGDARSLDLFIQALQSRNKSLQRTAAEALGRIGDARAVEPLIEALRLWSVREVAAKALGQLGDARALEALAEIALREGLEASTKKAAVEALAQLGDARAVKPLIYALGDPLGDVRKPARKALERWGEGALAEAMWEALQGLPRALVEMEDPRAVKPLVRLLLRGNETEVERAAQALGQMGALAAPALEPLQFRLQHEGFYSEVKPACRKALRQIEEALRAGPTELEAAPAPQGTGTELTAGEAETMIEGYQARSEENRRLAEEHLPVAREVWVDRD